jgi:hypothetical protein
MVGGDRGEDNHRKSHVMPFEAVGRAFSENIGLGPLRT